MSPALHDTSPEAEATAQAWREVRARFGDDAAHDPRRCRALLADLVGRVDRDHRRHITAVAAALHGARESGTPPDVDVIAQIMTRDGVSATHTRWALALVVGNTPKALTDEPKSGRPPTGVTIPTPRRRRLAVLVGACAVVGAAIVAVAVFASIRPTPESTPRPSRGSTPGPRVLDARFLPVREGAFMVERRWQVEEDTLRASAVLRPVADSRGGTHREAIVPTRVGAPTFVDPAPESYDDDVGVATFSDIALEGGEALRIAYVVGLPGSLGRADVIELYRQWLPQRESAISALDTRDPIAPPAF